MSTPFNDFTDGEDRTGNRQRPGPCMVVAFDGWNDSETQTPAKTGDAQ